MMRGIVLGDLWGIEEDVWVQLWSGVLGGGVSAVVAALVAVTVLTRSNRHQSELANQQLTEQRTEALRAREQAAIAEVLIAAEDFVEFTSFSEDLFGRVKVLQLAVARWRAELGTGEMQGEILVWPRVIRDASFARAASLRDDVSVDDAAKREALRLLIDSIAKVTSSALAWQRSSDTERDAICRDLVRTRQEIQASISELPDSLRRRQGSSPYTLQPSGRA